MTNALTTEDFIQRSIEAHKPYHEHYDYSKAIYIKTTKKITITCKFHGDFEVIAATHLGGAHCNKCNKMINSIIKEENIRLQKIANNYEIQEKAKDFYNRVDERFGRFNYSKSVFENMSTPIIIKCTWHGEFEQTPSVHLSHLTGCPECNQLVAKWRNDRTTPAFIKKARKVHGWLYEYDKVEFIDNKTPITIICPDHGVFNQTPSNHLRGGGCQKCGGRFGAKETEWIEYMEERIGYSLVTDHTTLKMADGKVYFPDAYDPDTKTVYEFDGDYYHGNPNRYAPDQTNYTSKKTMGELYEATLKKKSDLETNGYTVLSIWESEWDAFKTTLPDRFPNIKAA